MLSDAQLVAFVTTAKPAEARLFYRDTLGLSMISEDGFALVFDCNGTTLRIAIASHVSPAPYTVLGWNVTNIAVAVKDLAAKGVAFERFPGMPQNHLGIWTAPSGAQIAWFKDPDGNLLSLSQLS